MANCCLCYILTSYINKDIQTTLFSDDKIAYCFKFIFSYYIGFQYNSYVYITFNLICSGFLFFYNSRCNTDYSSLFRKYIQHFVSQNVCPPLIKTTFYFRLKIEFILFIFNRMNQTQHCFRFRFNCCVIFVRHQLFAN